MTFWNGLSHKARAGLLAGVAIILLATAVAAWWTFRTDYQVLFSDLKPQDAQAMTSELERLKVPYVLGENGSSILVDKASVHATRLKLMGKEIPLHGAVGLELFNNTDFGMTEFAQKINYQRALQGELTRTIQSLAEVREVRVLLALPEQSLFKQATSKAKASITVALRQGHALRAEQVTGIQRLVAAAVPGMARQDVTIADDHGVALTRAEGDTEVEESSARLDLKRETEAYLVRKVETVLERSFGPGQTMATVDVLLNMDRIRTTTEDVLPAASRTGFQATGVVVRESESLRDAGSPVDAKSGDAGARPSSQREVQYAVGRRVEQVVSQPGSVRHMQVVAVVRKALDASQLDQLRKVIAAAAGASLDRGDVVVVQSLALAPVGSTAPARLPADVSEDRLSDAPSLPAALPAGAPWRMESPWLVLAVGALLVLLILATRRARRVSTQPGTAAPRAPMSDADREMALRRVRDWVHGGATASEERASRTVPPSGGSA
ncbi:flagellar basal-body MS-ring/collar protein FliF [Variovorax arabinosiphilus]|uniref:flagellar basal-body MS-ring/collar protein FliF n=1 Tax=Variovorax arabinosiphilus TaxID=3053498 RepID=UPI0025769B33|nr:MULTISPECIES: flagellar basal-body MS-ring/collar protein FliF [unclassified Variovorax]MDM0122190.1 flagellar basal-body MS-ring/collar protein FliF [Variovorax sp. J2L1-78]MDM0131281.1 flagellar basal-body MS-ring/collar protein FliF [Variovorax sp. J2L1-63]MDM0234953.1 flagellar basal-body MS-ring/collar protein FliF [Variovorax sp. J2R1-6]